MNKNHILVLTLLSCLVTSPVYAQQSKESSGGWWKSFVEWMTAYNEDLDSTYVWQSPTDWTLTLENDMYRSGINLNTNGRLNYMDTPEKNHEYTWNGLTHSNFSDEVAVSLTWGSLSVGTGIGVIDKSTDERNRSNYLSFLDAGAGISINYNSIYSHINSVYHNFVTDSSVELNTIRPGHYKSLVVEGYDVISKDRFAFNACYDGSYVQRRTGGSFLLYAKYIHGSLDFPVDEFEFVDFNNNVMGYKTNQFFLGIGYGINWVLFHRDPTDGLQGLRNLTIHAVACPMLTLVNKLHYIKGEYDVATSQWVQVEDKVAVGQPDFNLALRSALCYNFGRFALSAVFVYNNFNLKTKGVDFMDNETDYFESKVNFYDWQALLMLHIRF